jgi:hypothetical protein
MQIMAIKRWNPARWLALAALGLLLASCGNSAALPTPQPSPEAGAVSNGGPALDQEGLLSALRGSGGEVALKGPVQQPFLSVEGAVITLNGAEVQVFEYPDTELAREEARRLAEAATGSGGAQPNWNGTPHVFAAGRVLVLYVGSDRDIFTRLQRVLGPSIA